MMMNRVDMIQRLIKKIVLLCKKEKLLMEKKRLLKGESLVVSKTIGKKTEMNKRKNEKKSMVAW